MDEKKCTDGLIRFIDDSPSCFHAVANTAQNFKSHGFVELDEKGEWNIEWGKSYFTVRNDSAIIAFRLPAKKADVKGYHISAAHCDSPTFKIKENPERKSEQYIILNVERYGGMIYSTWFDRALSIAGRIATEDKASGDIKTQLVNIDRDLLVIPNLAIHMNRDANKGSDLQVQTDLQPLFALRQEKGNKSVLDLIAKTAGVKTSEILGHDLFLYTREKGKTIGAEKEFILSPRLDDLQCVYAISQSIVSVQPENYISVCAVFDNEEVGSSSIQGADSTFLSDVLVRVNEGLKISDSKQKAWISSGLLISADNAHAVHPNHPEKADPTNRPYINGGPVLKFNSAQKYTTDGLTAAYFRKLCNKTGVSCQTYVNNSNIAGGSTLGNISTSHISIPSVDIGLPQLAMHSAVETAGAKDTYMLVKVMEEFYKM